MRTARSKIRENRRPGADLVAVPLAPLARARPDRGRGRRLGGRREAVAGPVAKKKGKDGVAIGSDL